MINSYQEVATQYKELDLSMGKIKVRTILLVEKVSFQRADKQKYTPLAKLLHTQNYGNSIQKLLMHFRISKFLLNKDQQDALLLLNLFE
jgi:hypothetical protein